MAALGLAAVVLGSALAVLLAGAIGAPLLAATRSRPRSEAVAGQLGTVGGLLAALYVWPPALRQWAAGQAGLAAVLALLPVGFAVVVFLNARLWLRRAEGAPPPVGWMPLAGGTSLVLVALGAGASFVRGSPPTAPAEGPDVVLVTVDGLGRDAVGALGGPETPHLDRLAAEGVAFLDAVSPCPASAPAHAAVLTGLHPLRARVIADGDPLPPEMPTLAEAAAAAGYLTAAFVSSRTVDSRSGFAQGFAVFDDDLWRPRLAPIAGLDRLALPALLLRAVRRWPGSQGRPDAETVDRFAAWESARSGQPAGPPTLAWIQLAGPARGADADPLVGRIVELIGPRRDRTLLVVAGTWGRAGAGTLGEAAVRVPLLLAGFVEGPAVPKVRAQVRLTDVAATLLDAMGIDGPGLTEGVSLLGYASGELTADLGTSLVGHDAAGRVLFGLRHDGIKYLRGPEGVEHLYRLEDDPEERVDLAGRQPGALGQVRAQLAPDLAALARLVGEG